MTRRALLIGSQTYGLTGCNGDVALMGDVLRGRGFQAIETLTDADASRAGMLTALERLVAALEPDDAVVVYYSGHGGRVPRPDAERRKTAGHTTHFHFLVPFDIDASAPGDFRGLLSEEITAVQRRMTDAFVSRGATPNVTLILDCCHSGYFARDADAVQKSVDLGDKALRLAGVREHAQRLGATAASLAGVTNPHAVRLVACQPEQSAYEMSSSRGGRHGAMTDALASVLAAVGDQPVAWSVLLDLVRRRVRARVPEQRPEIEGPAALTVFSTERAPVEDTLPVHVSGGTATIEAAVILGVDVGDELRLQRLGTREQLGTAVVSRMEGGSAVLSTAALPDDVVAVRVSSARPKYAIEGIGDLADSTRLRAATGDEPVLARVVEDNGFVVLDSLGARWRVAAYADARHAVDAIEEVAVGRRLLDLPSGVGAHQLDAPVVVELGVVRDGRVHALERHGARLDVGERVSLVVRNASAEQLYAWVFDVGVSGRASLLTNAAPSGALLGPSGSADDRLAVWSADGEPLYWPDDVPADAVREETFVIVLADRRADLSSLASPLVARGDEVHMPLRYRIEEVSFFLRPR